jgi:hypothetical protein
MTEAVLTALGLNVDEWISFYSDLPSKTTKVKVNNKQAVVCEWDEQRIKEPSGIYFMTLEKKISYHSFLILF